MRAFPNATVPPPVITPLVFMVTEEFCSAAFGNERVEDGAVKGIPVAPVTRKPLFPSPNVVVVLKRVVMFGVAPPDEKRGFPAVTPVTVPAHVPVNVIPDRLKQVPSFKVLRRRVAPLSPIKIPEGEVEPVPPCGAVSGGCAAVATEPPMRRRAKRVTKKR